MILLLATLASSPDPMFGPDKFRHAGVSFVLFTSSCTLIRDDCPCQRAAGAAGITVSAGLVKELYDLGVKGRFSYRDLLWDGVGLALGVAVMYLQAEAGRQR